MKEKLSMVCTRFWICPSGESEALSGLYRTLDLSGGRALSGLYRTLDLCVW